jgi:cell wall-active antibiotic response 4TMS protein YvqF
MAVTRPVDPARVRRRAYRGISAGVTLICIGIVLLLNTLGYVGWSVWFELLKLWPLLLVSMGLRWIFVNTRAHVLCLTGPVLVALAIFWVVSTWSGESAGGPMTWLVGGEMVGLDCPAPPSGDSARLDLDFVAGDLRILTEPVAVAAAESAPPGSTEGTAGTLGAAVSAPGFHGTLRYKGRQPRSSCGGSGDLRLRPYAYHHGIHFVFPFGGWENQWEARVASASPVIVDLRIAAASAELDLRAFDLERVHLEAAASQLRLQLGPAHSRVPVRIRGAVTDLKLVIPENTCYTVSRDKVLSLLDVEDSVQQEDEWRRLSSAACASAGPDAPRYEIRYEMPVSNVTIETEGRRT